MKLSHLKIVAVVVGFFAMITVTVVFDRQQWPVFHSWGMAHGAFLVAWPFLSFLAYRAIVFLKSDVTDLE